jgi:hypothetical protein
MSTVGVPGPMTRLARRHGLTHSPLRRSTDRVEAGITAALAVLALLTVLLATVIAMSTYRVQTKAATKAAQQSPVTAVLLTNPAVPFTDSPSRLSQAKRPPWRAGHYQRAATHRTPVGQRRPPCRRPDVDLDRSARQPRRPTRDILVHDR